MRQRASGFTMLEMMVVIALFAMTAEIAVPIMRWAIIDVHNSEVEAEAAAAEDRAMNAMRQDVWQARDIPIAATDHLVVVSSVGQQVRWQLAADGSIRRQDPVSDQQWTTGLSSLTFVREGSVVLVSVSRGPARPVSKFSMISPALLYSARTK